MRTYIHTYVQVSQLSVMRWLGRGRPYRRVGGSARCMAGSSTDCVGGWMDGWMGGRNASTRQKWSVRVCVSVESDPFIWLVFS